MLVSKKILKQYLVLSISFMIAILLVTLSDNIYVHIGSFIVFSLVAIALVKINLLHPYCWFSAFFCLYSIGHPLMYIIGFSSKIGYTKEIMYLQLLAMFVCLLFVSPKEVKYSDFKSLNGIKMNIGLFNKIILIILVISVLLASIYVIRSGYSGKGEIYELAPLIVKMVFRFPLIISLLYSISVISNYYKNGELPKREIGIIAISLVIITIFSGERDFIFRFLLITVFVLWFLNVLQVKHLLIIAPTLIALVPLSSTYKYFFLRGVKSVTNTNFLQSILAGEFESAGRNLQVLVNNSSTIKGVKGFGQIALDFISVFDSSIVSPSSWFGKTFYPNSQTQYGFTLVGEGYVIGGIIGIIVLFMIVGLIIKYFYKISNRNLYCLSGYMYFITVIIYSIRGDFGTILAAIAKQIVLVLFIVYICEKMAKQKV